MFRKFSLTTWIVIAVFAGVACGLLFLKFFPDVFQKDMADLGTGAALVRGAFVLAEKLFRNLLRMIIVPLILTSIVSGVLSVGSGKGLGRLGGKTAAYYVGTSTLAIPPKPCWARRSRLRPPMRTAIASRPGGRALRSSERPAPPTRRR